LPTATPESAGLCALGAGFIVVRSLTNQRSGFAARINQGAQRSQSLPFLAMVIHGGCARDTFGYAGFLDSRSANLRTAATSLRFAANRGGSNNQGASP